MGNPSDVLNDDLRERYALAVKAGAKLTFEEYCDLLESRSEETDEDKEIKLGLQIKYRNALQSGFKGTYEDYLDTVIVPEVERTEEEMQKEEEEFEAFVFTSLAEKLGFENFEVVEIFENEEDENSKPVIIVQNEAGEYFAISYEIDENESGMKFIFDDPIAVNAHTTYIPK